MDYKETFPFPRFFYYTTRFGNLWRLPGQNHGGEIHRHRLSRVYRCCEVHHSGILINISRLVISHLVYRYVWLLCISYATCESEKSLFSDARYQRGLIYQMFEFDLAWTVQINTVPTGVLIIFNCLIRHVLK